MRKLSGLRDAVAEFGSMVGLRFRAAVFAFRLVLADTLYELSVRVGGTIMVTPASACEAVESADELRGRLLASELMVHALRAELAPKVFDPGAFKESCASALRELALIAQQTMPPPRRFETLYGREVPPHVAVRNGG
jgi:hypothetical protein